MRAVCAGLAYESSEKSTNWSSWVQMLRASMNAGLRRLEPTLAREQTACGALRVRVTQRVRAYKKLECERVEELMLVRPVHLKE